MKTEKDYSILLDICQKLLVLALSPADAVDAEDRMKIIKTAIKLTQ